MKKCSKKLIVLTVGAFFLTHFAQAQNDTTNNSAPQTEKDYLTGKTDEELFSLSLEELMNIQVLSASLTGAKKINNPASVTVIDAESIKNTPARNLNDLIEIYVPGALWVNHHDGPHLGIRGIINDRNYKYLLLVNGVNMNQKAHNGATSELEHWDLNDIAKIEIVRGPGSVTYGPGAVMGVINIITKSAKETPEGMSTSIAANYLSDYNSKGLSISNCINQKGVSIFNYASIQSTNGIEPRAFTVASNTSYGYVGRDYTTGSSANTPNNYFADSRNKPQIKLHSQINTDNGFELFGRYTQSGTSGNGVNPKVNLQTGFFPDSSIMFGTPYNLKQLRAQHVTLSVKKKYSFTNNFYVTGSVVYDNENHVRYQSTPATYSLSPTTALNQKLYNSVLDPNSTRMTTFNFSEQEVTGNILFNYSPVKKINLALGGALVRNTWKAPWGKDERSLRMGDRSDIISDTNSFVYGKGTNLVDKGYFVGKGWSTTTSSVYGEVKYAIISKLSILVSGRADKDTYSKLLLSPRVALISDLNKRNSVRLIYQQSNRMNTAEQLYVQRVKGKQTTPERINSLELIYSSVVTNKLFVEASVFYNELQVLGWSSSDTNTINVGNMAVAGGELVVSYKTEKFNIGINHSLTHLADWKISGQTTASGISYGSYNQSVTYKDDLGATKTVVLTGYGKNINNWSNNSSKIFTDFKITEKLNAHVDAQFYYGFKGNEDGLNMLAQTFDTLTNATKHKAELNNLITEIKNKKVYQFQTRINISIGYNISSQVRLLVFAQNIAINNKRYSYDAGITSASPHRVAYVLEPTVYGAKMYWNF